MFPVLQRDKRDNYKCALVALGYKYNKYKYIYIEVMEKINAFFIVQLI